MRASFWNFGISIVETKKQHTDFFQTTCFKETKESKNMVVEKNFSVAINFYKKQCLPVITWNKKHLSKLVAPLAYSEEKSFFAVAIFLKVCESLLFFGLFETSLDFQRKEDQINTVYEK